MRNTAKGRTAVSRGIQKIEYESKLKMKKIKETEKGFYGCYWPVEGSGCAVIAMPGDDCEDIWQGAR